MAGSELPSDDDDSLVSDQGGVLEGTPSRWFGEMSEEWYSIFWVFFDDRPPAVSSSSLEFGNNDSQDESLSDDDGSIGNEEENEGQAEKAAKVDYDSSRGKPADSGREQSNATEKTDDEDEELMDIAMQVFQQIEMESKVPAIAVCLIVLFALLVRALLGTFPYSGENLPPRFGDYEAQRHWMEITLHTPLKTWYIETADNPKEHWPIDYPPLSAYVSLIFGWMLNMLEPESVALVTSRGYETATSRSLMRATVVMCDLLVYFPAVGLFVRTLLTGVRKAAQRQLLLAFICVLLSALLLVDHAHFQYNNVSLGLFVLSMALFANDLDVWGCFAFVASLCFKQMGLYYSLAVSAYLLGKAAYRASRTSWMRGSLYLVKLFGGTICSFALFVSPWIGSEDFALLDIVHRIFPVQRGVFEDKVASVWCCLSLVVKVQRYDPEFMLRVCALSTLLSCLPFVVQVFRNPTPRRLILSCSGCALSFYLFSFQVHEKQIVLAVVPLAFLALEQPALVYWMSMVASFSMYPLLSRVDLYLPYFCCQVMTFATYSGVRTDPKVDKRVSLGMDCGLIGMVLLHAAFALGPDIGGLPDFYTFVVMLYCCANFVMIYAALLLLICQDEPIAYGKRAVLAVERTQHGGITQRVRLVPNERAQ